MAKPDDGICRQTIYGVMCTKKLGHSGDCVKPKPQPICGDYTDEGFRCHKKPGHSGKCE